MPVVRRRSQRLAGRVFVLELTIIAVPATSAASASSSHAEQAAHDAVRDVVLAVAEGIAVTPTVRDALSRLGPSALLQPFAERVRRETAPDVVMVMNPRGIRYSHPDPALIGGRYIGNIPPAVGGTAFTDTYTGTLGPSVRAVVPVDDGGTARGLVAVGITVTAVERRQQDQVPSLVAAALAAMLLAGAGYRMVHRWLRRTTHDLGPAEMSRMYEFYDAVLHAVREGLLLFDRGGRLQLDNDDVVFRVADSGRGPDQGDVVRSFQRGWTTKPADGLPSLGFALVAQAVHRYGGRIDVATDHGVVFTVRLPLRRDGRDERTPAPPLVPAVAVGGTVLAANVG
jgi:two-component system, CitB family, sensor kinase